MRILPIALLLLLTVPAVHLATSSSGAKAPGPVAVPATSSHARPAAVHPLAGPVAHWNKDCGITGSSTQCNPQPPNTRGAAMAFDNVSGYAIAFGGTGTTAPAGATRNQTWTFMGPTAWTNNTSLTSNPTSRANASMVWDGTDNYVLMYGGYTSGGTANFKRFLNDTWYWNDPAQKWVQIVTPFASTPWHRTGACMVWIPRLPGGIGGYVLLFGGKLNFTIGTSTFPTQTWEFKAGAWTNVTASVGAAPTGRMGASCMWDPVDKYAIMFGGIDSTNTPRNDTVKFDPGIGSVGGWVTLLANGANGQPNPRFWAAGTYSTQYGADVLFSGGFNTIAAVKNRTADTWSFSGGLWTNITSAVNPAHGTSGVPPGGWDSGVSDTPWNYIVIFGGETVNSATSNSVYALGVTVAANIAGEPGEMQPGTTVEFWGNGTGGSGPGSYTLVYNGLPPSCSSANTSTITCQPNAAGVYLVTLTVTDASGAVATSPNPFKLVIDSVNTVLGTLVPGNQVNSVSPNFLIGSIWSNLTGVRTPSAVAALLNATPIREIKFYGQFDKTNISQNLYYCNSNSVACAVSTYNLTRYHQLCVDIGCTAILNPPSQVADPNIAAATVTYLEGTFHWNVPIYTLGVEPTSWNHYGIPFSHWATTDNVAPNATQYAATVNAYISAMRAVDPAIKFVAPELPMEPANNLEPWFKTLGQTSCANLLAGGDDSYVGKRGSASYLTLTTFFANLSTLKTILVNEYGNITAGCGATAPYQRWILETQGGQAKISAWIPYLTSFPDATWTAAAIAEALTYGATGFNRWIFLQDSTTGGGGWVDSMINATTLLPTPAYYLYSSMLTHFPWAKVYSANVSTGMNGTFAVTGKNSTDSATLVVNTNTTVSLQLTIPTDATRPTRLYFDDPLNGPRTAFYAVGQAPTQFTVQPLGVVVFDQGTANASSGILAVSSPAGGLIGFLSSPLFPVLLVGGLVGGIAYAIAVPRQASRRSRG